MTHTRTRSPSPAQATEWSSPASSWANEALKTLTAYIFCQKIIHLDIRLIARVWLAGLAWVQGLLQGNPLSRSKQ